jgi:hypothetical protein
MQVLTNSLVLLLCVKYKDTNINAEPFITDIYGNTINFKQDKEVKINGWSMIRFELNASEETNVRGFYIKFENISDQDVRLEFPYNNDRSNILS